MSQQNSNQKTMAHDAGRTRISRTELERRWALVRARMEASNIDALVAVSNDYVTHGSYAKWLTGEQFSYTVGIVFHRLDLMTRVEHGSEGVTRTLNGDEPGYRGVGTVKRTAEFLAVGYSHKRHVALTIEDLTKRGYRRIGLLGPERMSYSLVDGLKTALPNVEFVDETDFLDRLIAIKGSEEIALIKENIDIQTAAFNKLLGKIGPGMTDTDMANLLRSEVYSLGGGNGVCEVGSAPSGQPAIFMSTAPHRKLEKGDQVTILLETTGPDGYFTELGRTIVLGRASNELHDAVAVAVEAMDRARRKIKPGAPFADAINTHNEFMTELGLAPEKRVLGHGQGYDVVQRPLVRGDETMLAEEGMFLAMHPSFLSKGAFAWMCDNFFIERGGVGATLHPVPQKVFEV